MATTTVRLVPESAFRNGALADAVFTTTTGRVIGLSHAARSEAATSGPRRLKRASFPSKVP
ncbi:MAG: hypothetical protein U1G08_12270 [Verrucomicrobiota bacterium]